MSSIRRQLTVSLAITIVAAFGVAGGILHVTVKDSLVTQFDRGLAAKAGALATLLEYDPPHLEFEFAGEVMPEFEGGPDPEYFHLWLINGVEIERSETLEEARAELPRRAGPVGEPEHWDLLLADGRAGRAVGCRLIRPVM